MRSIPCEGTTADLQPCTARTLNPSRWCGRCVHPHRVSFADPTAMRASVTARAKAAAKADPRWNAVQRMRYFAFDRLLARVFVAQPNSWILKGGGALMARLDNARPSDDLDISYLEGDLDAALRALRTVVECNLGDFFRFTVADPSALIEGNVRGARVAIDSFIGDVPFVKFHIDLTSNSTDLTSVPDEVAPLSPIDVPNLFQVSYRCWPLANHIADKLAATNERYGTRQLPSSRFRDLTDLYLLTTQFSYDADQVRSAILVEFNRRGLVVPRHFQVPDKRTWKPGWTKLAPASTITKGVAFDTAIATIEQFLDPILQGKTTGHWDNAWS